MELFVVALSIAGLTFPIAAIVLIGLGAVRFGYFDAAGAPYLARFFTHVALPAALFSVISIQDLSTLLNPGFFRSYGLGTVLAAASVCFLMIALGRGVQIAGISMIGGVVSNCMIVGVPIAIILLDTRAVAALGMVSFFQDALLTPVALAIADLGRGGNWRKTLFSTIWRNMRTPWVIAIFMGICVAALPFETPAPVFRIVEILATSLAGIGLFTIGVLLANQGAKLPWRTMLPVASTKLLIHPTLVGLSFWLFPIEDKSMILGAVLGASMPMVVYYTTFAMRYDHGDEAAATTLFTTLSSFITIAMVMAVAMQIWG